MRISATVVVVVSAVLCFGQSAAVEADNRRAAEAFLTLTNAEENLADIRVQIDQMMTQMMTAEMRSMDVPESMRDKVVQFQQQLRDTIFEEFSFSKMKSAYVEVYASTFTPDELSGLIAFYKTPVGRAYAEKAPTVMKRMMEVSQAKMQALVPRVKKMHDDFIAELKKSAAPQ